MDPRHSAEAELFRKRIRAFLDENLPAAWQGIGAIAKEVFRTEGTAGAQRQGSRPPVVRQEDN